MWELTCYAILLSSHVLKRNSRPGNWFGISKASWMTKLIFDLCLLGDFKSLINSEQSDSRTAGCLIQSAARVKPALQAKASVSTSTAFVSTCQAVSKTMPSWIVIPNYNSNSSGTGLRREGSINIRGVWHDCTFSQKQFSVRLYGWRAELKTFVIWLSNF